MTIQVTHTHGERIAVASGGVELLSYVYRPDPDPFESRKPYIHPLRTLAGNLVSGYRPNDHRWHKGLQMTASHLSQQNFWGGNSYLGPEVGYQRVDERVGSMRHDGFASVESTDERLDIAEELTWVENGGAEWARERRGVSVHSVDADSGSDSGSYAIDWSIDLTNIREEPLAFGSPTTAGREMAGYTGLQWRGPRDFTGGAVLGPEEGQEGQELMGTQGPWLAFSAPHDDVDAHSTLVFAHAPENLDAGRAIHPSHWFVRSTPIPTVAFSWAFFEEFELAPGASFAFRYRVLVADGAWDRARIAGRLKELPW
ncbi:oxidoreductase [Streptomyces sp. 3MP-14]|uniref:Oxidoreductase n=1 Tax=Streptomyces mimosae TaxID=2586635 RepID=A0A5N6AEK3_9ACTN|nr:MULTISPECIES: PmoA family protein [Streptomyces]KAB8166279.1 oxidoreductase [Streptomyces mimosae]KAB8174072.1 oxidoreductase [Streptomyces sp. 3MP-14]